MNHHQPDLSAQNRAVLRDAIAQIALLMPDVVEAALKDAELRRQGAASPANPYASYLPNPHYYRGSAGYGTACLTCGKGPDAHDMNAAHEPAAGHLAQHLGADPVCVICGIDHDAFGRSVMAATGRRAKFGHLPEPTVEVPAEALAKHAPRGAL